MGVSFQKLGPFSLGFYGALVRLGKGGFDLGLVIVVISESSVHLAQGKRHGKYVEHLPGDIAFTLQGDDIHHADASAIDTGFPTADFRVFRDVGVDGSRRGSHDTTSILCSLFDGSWGT